MCTEQNSTQTIAQDKKQTNILGLLVCQYELEDADTCPSLSLPVVGFWVQLLQRIKSFGCVVELAHLKHSML